MNPTADADAPLKARIVEEPSLVLDDPTVMQALLDAADGGARNVVDLRGALVSRLESRLEKAEKAHRSVIAAAYEALAGAAQVHRAVLLMMEQRALPDLLKAMLVDAPETLAVDSARLCMEVEDDAVPLLPPAVARRVVALPTGAIPAYVALGDTPDREGVWLRRTPSEAELVYGGEAAGLRSEALIRLDLGRSGPAMLAFAAEDPTRFSPEHGVDLVLFLQGAAERLLRRALDTR